MQRKRKIQSCLGPRTQKAGRYFSDPSMVLSRSLLILLRKLLILSQSTGSKAFFQVHLQWALSYWPCNLHYWSRNYIPISKYRQTGPGKQGQKTCFQTPHLHGHQQSHIQVTTTVLLNCPFMSNPFQENATSAESSATELCRDLQLQGVGWATESSVRCSGIASRPELSNRNIELKFSQKQPH